MEEKNSSLELATDCSCEDLKLYSIDFVVEDNGEGCAIVKAHNPKEAETLLRTEGTYNGSSHLYRVLRIGEIIPSPKAMLISEQIVPYIR